nr:ice-binding protein [bacterium]
MTAFQWRCALSERLSWVVLSALLSWMPTAGAQGLGSAATFGVLAGSTVTNTGSTIITGNLGVSPGSAITGFPPGVVVPPGVIHAADAVAAQAQADLTTAYNAAASTPTTVDLTGVNLGGLTLTPGVYGFSSSAQLTGTLTLDAQGNPNALFLFKVGSSLGAASGASVVVVNGGTGCNAYWQVGTSATIGTGASFAGNILALASITLNTGSTLQGSALARNGAVTLNGNNVTVCPSAPPVVCPQVTLSPTTLPPGVSGAPYAQLITATGGTGPYTYSISSGTLPPGLSLNAATGAITGTPTSFGTFDFIVTALDANGCPGTRPYEIIVAAPSCPAITLTPTTLPSGPVGVGYSSFVTGTGGVAPYSYAVSAGALPTGLTLGAGTGVINGTPSAIGIFTFTITASDLNSCPGSRQYVIVVADRLPASQPVPTLSDAGLGLLTLLLAVVAMRRRARV